MGETSTTPTPRAYIVGAELRDARERAGLGLRELAKRLDVSHSVIVRWEKGERLPSTVNTSALLAILGVSSAERDRIVATVGEAWDEPVNSVSVGIAGMADQLTALMEFERHATAITSVSPLLIPGLLQTSDYSRAIIGDTPESEAKVAVRLGRRDVITRHRSPAQYQAMIAESVLYQPIGAEVMEDQLRLVHKLAEQDNVRIRIIPTSAGFTPAHAGPFVLLEFDKAGPVVHLEHHRSSVFLRDPGDVQAYLSAREDLERVAMSPEASAGLIADVINRNGA